MNAGTVADMLADDRYAVVDALRLGDARARLLKMRVIAGSDEGPALAYSEHPGFSSAPDLVVVGEQWLPSRRVS